MNELYWPGQRPEAVEYNQVCEPPQGLIRQAVIMAGGKGARLHPYSAVFPKPLMPLGDMPILELLLRRMKAVGVQEVILAVNHLRHLIEAYFGDGSELGIRLYYSNEEKPLGTAGALGNMLHLLDEKFFLTNGDLLTTMDLRRMALSHASENADASLGIYERENKIDFGLIEFDARKRLSRLSGEAYKQVLCQHGRLYSPARGRSRSCFRCRLPGHAKPFAENQGQQRQCDLLP